MGPKSKRRLKKSFKNHQHHQHHNGNDESSSPQQTKISEEMLERILFRWYQKYQQKKKRVDSVEADMEVTIVLRCQDLLTKARSIVDKVECVENLREKLNLSWIQRWQKLYGIFNKNEIHEEPTKIEETSNEEIVENDVTLSVIPTEQCQSMDLSTANKETPSAAIDDYAKPEVAEEYTLEQIYYVYCYTFNLKSLPDKNYQNDNEYITVLMAANQSGTHRTRVLVTGKEWRPYCLKHVNMVTQPVVYAGGGNGTVTPELFKWWFYKEFEPVVSMLYPKIVLYCSDKDFVQSLESSYDNNSRVSVKLILDPNQYNFNIVLWEFRTLFTSMLLRNYLNFKADDSTFSNYLQEFNLKDAFLLTHRAWLQIRAETFQRSWMLVQNSMKGDDDPPVNGTKKRKLIFSVEGTDVDLQGDNNLLLELQWMTHDLGLEVSDDDLLAWVNQISDRLINNIKTEDSVNDDVKDYSEKVQNDNNKIVEHLEKVIYWMESEPFNSNLLLCMQDVLTYAKKASKMGLGPGSHPGAAALPFFCHNGEHLAAQPPPAHMGIPPYQLDTKAAGMGLTRPPMYPFSPGQYPYPMLSPEMSQVASWHTPSMYPISTAATGFRSPYPTSLPIPSSSLPSDFYRFSPGLMPPHPGLSPHSHPLASHPAIVTPGPKQDLPHTTDHNHRYARSSMDQKNSSSADNKNNQDGNNANDKKKPHIKKPLNAFMLYMKEMRAKVVAECTLKESAAINQILGRRWHALGREEQAKYYELARRERQLHMQLYPDWSSRANASRGKKRKRKQETNEGGNSMKKCRARYGLEHQSQWCKPCRRKKKCIRYMETGDSNDGNHSDDNLGSCGSVGDAQSPPEDDAESINQSLSSPGGLSGLSSLTSPSMILPSPSTSLASPSVSLASPCMSLQSPLTPHDGTYDIKPLILSTTSSLSVHQQSTSNGSNNGNGNSNSDVNNYDCKPINLPTTSSLQITSHLNHHQPSFHNNTPHRNPVGTNPHDINNPLSVNQLTGQCIKNSNSNTNVENSQQNGNNNNESSRPVISVT